jgi:FkbM family methyltransferase
MIWTTINVKLLKIVNSILKGRVTIFSRSQLRSHNLQDLCIDFFIYKSKGVLHIGAFDGKQFAKHYNSFSKPVIWIEANDLIFPILKQTISDFPNQRAFNLLLGGSKKIVKFFEYTNLGSSSIFPMNERNPWNLRTQLSRNLPMTTLSEHFTVGDISEFDFWVIDTQGAELEVLKGSRELLKSCCRYLYLEVSNNTEYLGGAEYKEIQTFLRSNGFVAAWDFSGFHGDVLFINSKSVNHNIKADSFTFN